MKSYKSGTLTTPSSPALENSRELPSIYSTFLPSPKPFKKLSLVSSRRALQLSSVLEDAPKLTPVAARRPNQSLVKRYPSFSYRKIATNRGSSSTVVPS